MLTRFVQRIKNHISFKDSEKENTIILFDSGHWTEKLRDESLNEVLVKFKHKFQVIRIKTDLYPELFELMGVRITAYAMIENNLFKDVVSKEQWLEILNLNENSFHQPDSSFHVFDFHTHIEPGSTRIYQKIMSQNGIKKNVIMALPKNKSYQGIDQSNQMILNLAKKNTNTTIPFVILNPQDPLAEKKFLDALKKGAKGLKLINGHGAYYEKSSIKRLDPPQLRKVFKVCESKKIPVLWHVNSHLFNLGFFQVLSDFPNLKVIIPHYAGYLTYTPETLRSMLNQYPNLYVDISLGGDPFYIRFPFEDISIRASEWRDLLNQYASRFVFGIDLVINSEMSASYASHLYNTYRNQLENEHFDLILFDQRGWNWPWENSHTHKNLSGLALPASTLEMIYWKNAIKILGLNP